MDYHSDRFKDYSPYSSRRKTHSILPAHQVRKTLCSHFGPYLWRTDHEHPRDRFQMLSNSLRTECLSAPSTGFKRYSIVLFPGSIISILQKKISMPSSGNARLIFCSAISAQPSFHAAEIALAERLRRRSQRRLIRMEDRSKDAKACRISGKVLDENLKTISRFAKPVHTLQEMELLKSRFP